MTEQSKATRSRNESGHSKSAKGQQQQLKSVDNTVFVRFVPSVETIRRHHVEDLFSQVGPIKKSSVIHNNGTSYGFVKYTTQTDAELASYQMNNRTIQIDAYTPLVSVKVELAKNINSNSPANANNNNTLGRANRKHMKHNETTNTTNTEKDLDGANDDNDMIKKRNRLIVRNLSFYAKENDIRTVFEEKFGKLLDIHIPMVPISNSNNNSNKKQKQQHRGFCFVTFENEKSVHKCMKYIATEPITIKERNVTVSKALHKTAYEARQQQQHEGGVNVSAILNSNSNKEQHETKDKTENDDENGDENDDENDDENKNDNDDVEDDDDEDDSENSDDDDEKNDDDNINNDGGTSSSTKKKNTDRDLTAVQEKRCVFVRNIPFDTTRHDLFELFRKFGRITSIFIVKDKNNGYIPTGTAFVSFEKQEQAIHVLTKSKEEEENSIIVDTNEDDNNDTTATKFTSQRDAATTQKLLADDGATAATTKTMSADAVLVLKGRQLLVDLAVDKETAATLAITADDSSKGQDRRNLYLLKEGRVENNEKDGIMEWDKLSESDKFKRQSAWSEKNTKLKSPLFFINPIRLSVRNVAKHITEKELKQLCAEAVESGLENKVVTTQDQINHWRATGALSTREILTRIQKAEEEQTKVDDNGEVKTHDQVLIQKFDSHNIKQYIPSVFISREFVPAGTIPASKGEIPPSRGFGFVEFAHHIHALACLRQLNNNPTYSELYTAGGKKAANDLKLANRRKLSSKKLKNNDDDTDDGAVKVPRLIVDFAVENKAKAKQQLEHRAQQQANMLKQKLENKSANNKSNAKAGGNKSPAGTKTKKDTKKSRGALQRERKRKEREEGISADSAEKTKTISNMKDDDGDNDDDGNDVAIPMKKPFVDKREKKFVAPPKKKAKTDPSEEHFTKLVESYKQQFMNVSSSDTSTKATSSPTTAAATDDAVVSAMKTNKLTKKKRWFE